MEMCDLGENSPPFVSMPLAAMRKAVDYLSGECLKGLLCAVAVAAGHVKVLEAFSSSTLRRVDTAAEYIHSVSDVE